jgi:hypothetical protein
MEEARGNQDAKQPFALKAKAQLTHLPQIR